jgi:hypothetical protein
VDETPPLFYLQSPLGLQPIRAGDLVRVKQLGYDWILEGKVLLVLGASHAWGRDEAQEVEEAHGIIEGEMRMVRIEDLELLECAD